jgi:hypothetical protein
VYGVYLHVGHTWEEARHLNLFIPHRHVLFRLRGCIQKFPDRVDNEIYANLWYYSLRSNTKGYGGKTHYTDSQNSDTTAPSGRELYHLQFSRQAASPGTFGYIFVSWFIWQRCVECLDCLASNERMVVNDDLVKVAWRRGYGLYEGSSSMCLEGLRKTSKNSIRITDRGQRGEPGTSRIQLYRVWDLRSSRR